MIGVSELFIISMILVDKIPTATQIGKAYYAGNFNDI